MSHESINREAHGPNGERKKERRTARIIGPVKERVREAIDRPALAASLVGGVVAAAAGLWGPTEAALGAFAAFVVYRMLRKRKLARV